MQEGNQTRILWEGEKEIVVQYQTDFIKQKFIFLFFQNQINPPEIE